MRRLDLNPEKKLRNPARHIRALETWSRSLAGFFPTPDITRDGRWFARIPIFEKVVAPPHSSPDLVKTCAQSMIDAADHIRHARPPGHDDSRVYTFLTFPNLFASFVEVAFETNPHLFFNLPAPGGREGNDACWREFFDIDRDRFDELHLQIPAGFHVLGIGVRRFDADGMTEPQTQEFWAIGELNRA